MADRFPLIANSSSNQIQEVPAGDRLDLTGTDLINVNTAGVGSVTAPVSGLSTVTINKELTIGVRSGAAVTFTITGNTFNVINRAGGNVAIDV